MKKAIAIPVKTKSGFHRIAAYEKRRYQMSKRALLVGMWVCCLLSLTFLPAAYAGISNVAPAEGTVGTQLVVSGSGFGTKHGEVLLGEEECKVLFWSNTEIICEVNKPQPAGLYAVTVVPRKGESMTVEPFAMRRPRLLAEGWAWDGKTVTLNAQFLGDKKGDIFFVVPDEQVEAPEAFEAKVVDWSTDAVRFEIPRELRGYSGDRIFVMAANQVGRGGLFVSLSGGMPAAADEYAHNFGLSHDNVSGIHLDNFPTNPGLHFGAFYPCAEGLLTCGGGKDNAIVGLNVYVTPTTTGYLETDPFSTETGVAFPLGQTDTAVVPLLIENKLWLFFTGHDGGLYYNRYDGTQWNPQTGFKRIEIQGADVSTNTDWEIAPVYNSTTHRIEVYYEYYQKLYWVYSADYGATWHAGGQVTGIEVGGVTTLSQAPSAVYYSQTSSVLVAVGISNQAYVFSIQNGAAVGTPTGFGSVNGRPFLADLSTSYLGLTWHTQSGGVPYVSKMTKSTGVWATKYQPITEGSKYAPSISVWGGQLYLNWGRSEAFGTDAVMEAFY